MEKWAHIAFSATKEAGSGASLCSEATLDLETDDGIPNCGGDGPPSLYIYVQTRATDVVSLLSNVEAK